MREYTDVRGVSSEYVKLANAVDVEGVEVDAPTHSEVGDCGRTLVVMRATTMYP